jgi:hypothetical protein
MKVFIIDCVGDDSGTAIISKKEVENRADAVRWIKEMLKLYMTDSDRFSWDYSDDAVRRDQPDLCFVRTEYGDDLDVYGFVKN